MDSIDTVSNAARLTDRLKEFVNGTSVPRSLTVSDTELESSASSAILPFLWLTLTESHLEFAVFVRPGFNPAMPQWTTFTLYRKGEPIPGIISNLCISSAISAKVTALTEVREVRPDNALGTIGGVEGHGTG